MTDLQKALMQAIEESQAYEPCMSLYVCEEGKAVELCLDTAASTYSEWIHGEGGDIGLMRCQETKRVMGVRLPLYRNNLVVGTSGPILINEGFKRGEPQEAAERGAAVKTKLETIRQLLFEAEIALVNSLACGHPECDMGACTHPLRLVRQALKAGKD